MKKIIEMAREADGLGFVHDACDAPSKWQFTPKELERFAALVRADEREAFANDWETLHGYDKHGVAAAIRARGNT